MRSLFTLLLIASSIGVFAQGKGITVSVLKQSITVIPGEENGDKQIVIHANIKSTEKLKILNRLDEKEWKRTFEIYDSADRSLLKIPATNQAAYQVTIKNIRSALPKGIYSIYTMAIPADPNVAATARVRRMLVCQLIVK